MLFPRRGRAFLIFPVVLVLVVWYYPDFQGPSFRFETNLSKDSEAQQPVALPTAVLSTAVEEPHLTPTRVFVEPSPNQTTPPTPIVEPTQSFRTTDTTPDLVTSPSDVLLIVKTGSSTFWRRMPLHLTTTLANNRIPNSVIYSDRQETLSNGVESINILEKVADSIKAYDSIAHGSYLELQSPNHINTYREHGQLPGDELTAKPGNAPGWLLDKYKFLPMFKHAQRNWPDVQWTIYIEDDTFLFWDNILRWLSTLSPDGEPAYYGFKSGEGNETFAQGGSGLVFSRSLMRSVFGGPKPPDISEYGNYTSKSCCGDTVFGKVLRDRGIFVNKGQYGAVSFRPEPPWRTGFDVIIWCAPVFTFHHLHQRDLVQLAELERLQRESYMPTRPTIFRDIFNALILPHLTSDTRKNWDNYASKFVLTRNSSTGFQPTFKPANNTTFAQAFQSPAACRTACIVFDECMSWRHETATGICTFESFLRLGREVDPQHDWETKTEIISGWDLEKMDRMLLRETCNVVTDPWMDW